MKDTGKEMWRIQGTGVWMIQVKECGGYWFRNVEETGNRSVVKECERYRDHAEV